MFQKGKTKTGGIKKGQKQKRTVLKEKLGIESIQKIDEFAGILIRNWIEFLSSEDDAIRLTATKELSKFVFPTKKQVESSVRPMGIEDVIKETQNERFDSTDEAGDSEPQLRAS